jgi:hypothetical protein
MVSGCPRCGRVHWYADGLVVYRDGSEIYAVRSNPPQGEGHRWSCIACGYELRPLSPIIGELEALVAQEGL